jgi:putative endonuclease
MEKLMTSRREFGLWGENIAANYLRKNGYEIVDRNVYTKYGEIDLVVGQGDCIVFVEVKTRSSTAFGLPEEAITEQKQVHLLESAQAYLQMHPKLSGDWRIDVIAVQRFSQDQEPEIVHFENAFT